MTHGSAAEENATVVGVDDSPASLGAVRWAAADSASRAGTLVLVHADPGIEVSFSDAINLRGGRVASARSRARSTLERSRIAAESVAGESLSIEKVLAAGRPADVLTDYARDAWMVVVGSKAASSRGAGSLARGVLGSVCDHVAAHAHCPVVRVPEGYRQTKPDSANLPVVVGLDISVNNDAILAVAFDQASRGGVGLRVVHARADTEYRLDPGPPVESWLTEVTAPWSERYPSVPVSPAVVTDKAPHAIIEESGHAQSIVVGSPSRGAMASVFTGSTSRAVLHHSSAPTIVVPVASLHHAH
ncbi:universal stress protein [Rhodococcus sp. BP-252]|uniref:universal stress protein n=1 Tax=unclassified Rhodococcus (in: high G+C Gram-positive bacteria) TaxID=192944 RepID=UPI001430DD1F|nr:MULTISPECIES: universal stress protein [unclassified Rhodococcus (in: high G+C Gram-positive bacteria)]MBY6410702.1 universal stress protein [Rhodococcus sp. BP-320]MBY6415473.1 universal stress protein [Rhodococcus sp. BP-321]MBY6420088.1 universal stress protein [Rhodococcus sp. BP-324]MBY6425258.1 universal stress protein [Rhodococcus sp. BP-323]MBY6430679.1 universal stress protein [Rhodococcus sp. BP-322]